MDNNRLVLSTEIKRTRSFEAIYCQEVKENMWLCLARWARYFEWVFGTVLMTAIGVIVSLKELKGGSFGQWALLIGLFIFLVASLIKQFDDAGWFKRYKPKIA